MTTYKPLNAKLPFHPTTGLQALGFRTNGAPIWPIAGADGRERITRSPMLQRLYDERDQCVEFVDRTVNGANDAKRDLSASEQETLTNTRKRIKELDEQIKPLEDFETLRSAGDAAGQRYRQTPPASPPAGPAAGGDATGLGAHTTPRAGDYKTAGQVIVDQLRAAPKGRGGMDDAAARDRLLGAKLRLAGDESRVVANQTTADTLGILPEPIVGAIVSNIDAKRPFITSIGPRDLGPIPGKVFSRPVITQHTAVAEQVTEKTELTSQKMIISGVDFTKKTFGGVVDISRQDIDWTSPAAWDALLTDLQAVYGKTTENAAADAFAAAITSAAIEVGSNDFIGWSTALYAAAAQAYGGVEELPNHIWASLDMWATLGPIIDQWTRQTAANGVARPAGSSSPASFDGNVLDFDRTVVPAFPANTLIVGVKEKTEFYEERIGLLTAVEPRLLGVEVAYGGYAAFGTLDIDGFAKVVNAV
jgi:hypothetical protein